MILAPSILCADLAHLGDEIRNAERGGADMVHVDVMDGQFVPNLSLGPEVVRAVRRVTTLPIDVHLMVRDADRYLDVFADAGADWISIHTEAVVHLERAVTHLRQRGLKAGVALNPATPLGVLDEILPAVDFILVMSVSPGFGGQTFVPGTLDKLRRLREGIRGRGLQTSIEVDGGVGPSNARSIVDAGADILVAGNAVFASGDAETGARRLKEACG